MTKYLISFPSAAMVLTDEEFAAAARDSRAVMQEAKDAGVYVFGGGIDEGVAPVRVSPDGAVTNETYPQTREFNGGICVLELPNREAALEWTAKIAKGCHCPQELREFMYDEMS